MGRIGTLVRGWSLAAAILLWLGAAVGGTLFLTSYSSLPGARGEPVPDWPVGLPLSLRSDMSSLFMFVHPQCTCSRASVHELSRIMTFAQGRIDARVLFFAPPDEEQKWVQSDLWRDAEEVPGVTVSTDPGGRSAQRLGILTSGHVVVYDAAGKLVFSGGITAARGHEGDSTGRAAILAHLDDQPARADAPVFGCALHDSECQCETEDHHS